MYANRITSHFVDDADDVRTTLPSPAFVMLPLPFLARPASAPCPANIIYEMAYQQAQAMIAARNWLRATAHPWN